MSAINVRNTLSGLTRTYLECNASECKLAETRSSTKFILTLLNYIKWDKNIGASLQYCLHLYDDNTRKN